MADTFQTGGSDLVADDHLVRDTPPTRADEFSAPKRKSGGCGRIEVDPSEFSSGDAGPLPCPEFVESGFSFEALLFEASSLHGLGSKQF